jgi:hypothetical protein
MGATKTLKVDYDPDFVSERGQCLEIYVPLVLHIRSIGVYNKAGNLMSRGIRAEVESVEEEKTLRKRGHHILPPAECAIGTLRGKLNSRDYDLSNQRATHLEKFNLSLAFNVARNVEFRFVEVFGRTFNALARVSHVRQLELEFQLPGSRNYYLSFNTAGLHWEFA